jgi:hypothetical protein
LSALVVLFVGVLGLGDWWRRRRRGPDETAPHEEPADPAVELRAKLAESRDEPATETEAEEAEPASQSEPLPADPEARRQEVHDAARASIDELR